jgi:hypothetical protein
VSTVTITIMYSVITFSLVLMGYGIIKYVVARRRLHQARVDKLVVDIIAMSQKQAHKSPPFIPVTHVRDTLLTNQEKTNQGFLWDRAVRYLSSNESRLRTENQIIKGEEYTVWHWVSLVAPETDKRSSNPAGHKKGGDDESQTPPIILRSEEASEARSEWGSKKLPPADIIPPTECIKLKNLVCPKTTDGDVDMKAARDSVKGLLTASGVRVRSVDIDSSSDEHAVYVCCVSLDQACDVYNEFVGRTYNGSEVFVKFLKLERYLDRFPHLRSGNFSYTATFMN